MTCHVCREFFVPKSQHFFSVLSIFEYNPGETNNRFIVIINIIYYIIIILSNLYPVIDER